MAGLGRRGLATLVRSALSRTAAEYPTKAAVLVRSAPSKPAGSVAGPAPHRWSAAGVVEHSGAVAQGLLELAAPGDAVAAALGNTAERVAVQLGAASAGLRLLDCGLGLSKEAVLKVLREHKVRVLCVAPSQMEAVYAALPGLKQLALDDSAPLRLAEAPHLRYVLQSGLVPLRGTHRFKDVLVYNALVDRVDGLARQDAAPFFAAVDAASGKVTAELTQKQALDQAAAKAKELKIVGDSRVVFKGSSGTALLHASLGCVMAKALLVIPAEVHDDKAITLAQDKDDCKIAFV
jgi:acyl-CoA synthetase (AMP-forming)/AMP-acid ligase II